MQQSPAKEKLEHRLFLTIEAWASLLAAAAAAGAAGGPVVML